MGRKGEIMKKLIHTLLALVLSLGFLLTSGNQVFSTSANLDESIAKLIHYRYKGATTDELRILDEIKRQSSDEYTKWNSIMNYWTYAEEQMKLNISVAPDGLPNDNSHAFIVLGFALKSDGTMQDELVGRLETALATYQKYPNSYILVTGGVPKNGHTEGELMNKWLLEHGVPETKIIVESESKDTAQNAQFSFEKMYEKGNIKTASLITSEYHLRRATILYYTQSLQSAALHNGELIELIGDGNAGWLREDKREEPMLTKARSLSLMPGGDVNKFFSSYILKPLPISELQKISVTGKQMYEKGETLDIKVFANYDIDSYQRDITNVAQITGYDCNVLGNQNITIRYTENDVEKTIQYSVIVTDVTSSIPEENPSDKPQETPSIAPPTGDSTNIGLSLTLLFGSLGVFMLARKRHV